MSKESGRNWETKYSSPTLRTKLAGWSLATPSLSALRSGKAKKTAGTNPGVAGSQNQWPQPFQYQGPVLWRMVFPWTGGVVVTWFCVLPGSYVCIVCVCVALGLHVPVAGGPWTSACLWTGSWGLLVKTDWKTPKKKKKAIYWVGILAEPRWQVKLWLRRNALMNVCNHHLL